MKICEVIIDDPIEFLTFKKKKYYLTANIFYGTVHFYIRSKIVDGCKLFLHNYLMRVPRIEVPIAMTIEYHTEKNTAFDIDNKGYFWGKLIQDWLVKNNKIDGDSTKYIQAVAYIYHRGPSKLVIKLEEMI